MPSILQGFRYALHLLRKSAGFTATATAILALVIGSTTTIFWQAIFPPGTPHAWDPMVALRCE